MKKRCVLEGVVNDAVALFNAKVSIESHKAPADVRDNFTCNSDQYFDRIPCQCENDVHGQSMRKIRF